MRRNSPVTTATRRGLSIAEIARRLGRAEATIKTYLYDPTGDKARAVKARYRGVCRGCGAPTAPRNGKGDAYAYCKRCHPGAIAPEWTRERVREAMHAWRARYGAAPSSYDWSRTHARRRGGEGSNEYRPEHGPHRPPSPICTGPGRRPAPTPSPAPERPGHNAVVTRTLALRLVICERGRRRSPHTPPPCVCVAATRASALGDRWARGATATCACKPPRIGPAGKHLDDSRNRGKGGPPTEPDGRARRHAHLWRNSGLSVPDGRDLHSIGEGSSV